MPAEAASPRIVRSSGRPAATSEPNASTRIASVTGHEMSSDFIIALLFASLKSDHIPGAPVRLTDDPVASPTSARSPFSSSAALHHLGRAGGGAALDDRRAAVPRDLRLRDRGDAFVRVEDRGDLRASVGARSPSPCTTTMSAYAPWPPNAPSICSRAGDGLGAASPPSRRPRARARPAARRRRARSRSRPRRARRGGRATPSRRRAVRAVRRSSPGPPFVTQGTRESTSDAGQLPETTYSHWFSATNTASARNHGLTETARNDGEQRHRPRKGEEDALELNVYAAHRTPPRAARRARRAGGGGRRRRSSQSSKTDSSAIA